jgi:GT2 family glycosyltransferase
MTTPKISIIIGFYNKIDLLEKILEALRLQTQLRFEVVIADDGSQPEVVARIHALQQELPFTLQHVWHEDKGWRKNAILNKAVVAAQGEYLIFIDGDCIPEPHFVEEHYAERKQGTVVSGRRILMGERATAYMLRGPLTRKRFGWGLFWMLLSDTLHGYKTRMEHMIHLRSPFLRRLFIKDYERFILGCNFSLYKKDLLSVNGFDERFEYPGYGEDIDLWYRLTRAGIHTYSRKALLIQYHCYHKRFDTDYAPNRQLMAENNEKGVTFTPYGIERQEVPCTPRQTS